ncbi:peptidyl-tRNA hydrolase [Hyphomicrobium nitrativorans NL23]|uniref:Peptidyl-tRNA hydrolase n=1 Tax=Hyphomicrobium nitrativorans NL23 TaxID=1029756 RepID=V5SFT7_9HYPH|nr:aminoacyl-tRNA hydrolase [Hyphomicrobium nitrativorans]AHB49761.1 peptidyl-tRNA hydrolase [Hyphomicrobium nitrativorans NL23]
MKLFVGLGNPGNEYARNRHNVGFMAADAIADAHGFGPWKRKFQGLAADGEIGGEKVLLLKPQTYMNESGRAVGEAARFLKIAEKDIVVFYDEIDLAPGKLKIKTGGGNAGHNGLRSMSAHIGNDYVRVRIGVGHPGVRELVARWVLSDFAKADQEWLEPLLGAIAKAAPRLVRDDQSRFLTDVAREIGEPADPRKDGKTGKDVDKGDGDAPAAQPKARSHPRGERAGKSANALAENLKKWLAGRKPSE